MLAAMLTAPLAPLQAQSMLRAAGQAVARLLFPSHPKVWASVSVGSGGSTLAPERSPLLPAVLQTPCCCLSLGANPACSPAVWGCVGGWQCASVASACWVSSQGGNVTVLLQERRSREGAAVFGCLATAADKQPLVPTALSQQAGASVAALSGASTASCLLGGGIDPRVGEVLKQGHVHVGLWRNSSQEPLVMVSPSTPCPRWHACLFYALGGGDGAPHAPKIMLGLPPPMVGSNRSSCWMFPSMPKRCSSIWTSPMQGGHPSHCHHHSPSWPPACG